MSRAEHLRRRLAIAIREAEDADRVWRATMELDVRLDSDRDTMLAARRLHAVWQERERAHARVRELQRRIDAGPRGPRIDRLQSRGSFLAWHTRRRLQRDDVHP